MQFAKHRNDEDISWMGNNKRFEEMDRETANLIKTLTGMAIHFDEKGDTVNMWTAWENGINQARNDGYNVGRNDGYNIGRNDGYNVGRNDGYNVGRNDGYNVGRNDGRNFTMVTSIRNLMETSGWSAKQTMDALKIPADEQEKYAKQI